MKFTVSDLKQKRQWRAFTGLDKERFETLLISFKQSYMNEYGNSLNDRLVKNNVPYCIHNEEELLLFTLFSLKSGLTYDVLGVVCGMDGSNAKRNQQIGLEILANTLEELGHMPRRNFMDANDFSSYFEETKELLIDATEQIKQRPCDNEKQKAYYSGKKNPTQSNQ